MSSLDAASEQSEHQPFEFLNIQRDMNIPRLAYEKLKQYSYEESKQPPHETDDAEKEACIKLLAELSLAYTEVDGEGLTSLINALLQHATGNYRQTTFDDTNTILSSLVEDIESSNMQAIQVETIQVAVNKAMQTNLLVGILCKNTGFRPDILEEIGFIEGVL
jgi:hypothetical protein